MKSIGALGIEPSLRAPKARVLPVYYAPKFHVLQSFTVSILLFKNGVFNMIYLAN